MIATQNQINRYSGGAVETNGATLWLETPYLPLRIRVAVDALAAELPRIMGESAAIPTSEARN